MGFRFRKSIKLLPGVRVNISKSGVSTTLGPRGASIGIGKQGTFLNIGIPGTGLSYRQRILSSRNTTKKTAERERKNTTENNFNSVVFGFNHKGEMSFFDEFGFELQKKYHEAIRKKRPADLSRWMQGIIEINRQHQEAITKIHVLTPPINKSPDFSEIKFNVSPPRRPEEPIFPARPTPPPPVKSTMFDKILPQRRRELREDIERQQDEFNESLQKWEDDRQEINSLYKNDLIEWEKDFNQWREAKKKFYESLEKIKNNSSSLGENPELAQIALEIELQRLEWPRETECSFQIGGNIVHVDIDLPEIEDMPQDEVAYSEDKKTLVIKNKTQQRLRQDYALHIHGIAFKVAGHIFSALPYCNEIILSGYSQRISKTTNKVENEYLYSVKFTREIFGSIDFLQINPIEAIEQFQHQRKMTKTGIFSPIAPYE